MSALAHYQRRLSRLLLKGHSPESIRQALLEDPALESLHGYIESLQDAPLEVAVELAAKWGRPL
ncbi:MAG: hypothetical protein ACRBN8_45955 [Nannocystales bacterium]